ncbi:MAG: hypothetical protein Q7W44_10670 [Coriobacteriia bacterium]|nr:hypothetical protein [Coriobacteriia bacterium]
MSTEHTGTDGQGGPAKVTRFADVIEHDGHAWVIARDTRTWFYECLRCGERCHVSTIEAMNKAVTHEYAYMAFNHRAPWKMGDPIHVATGPGTFELVEREPYPSCGRAADPVRHLDELERGPLITVPRARPKPQPRPE